MGLVLEWQDGGQMQRLTLGDRALRIGRDPARCDVVLTHPTVSGLHVEIFYQPLQQGYALRNLRASNPPLVDGQKAIAPEVPLRAGQTIRLGLVELKVVTIAPAEATAYGLQCPNPSCQRVSSYDYLNLGCPWCGRSLAAAQSMLLTPEAER